MARTHQYVLCLKNRGYSGALEVRKVYRMVSDATAEKRGLLRVIDESGDDYLYPASFFVAIEVPRKALGMFSKKSA
jgi:hypothetical protein